MPELETDLETLPPDRRGFVKRVVAFGIGGIAMLPPLFAGLALLFDPLRRPRAKSVMVPVATLAALPEDGAPRKFSIVTDRVDAWNKVPAVPIGAVYLRRLAKDKVQALNVVCPHAGCFVNYDPAREGFKCPCHDSSFKIDGSLLDPNSPSPRAMDELSVEIRKGTEVWVKFQNFRAGVAEKIPLA